MAISVVMISCVLLCTFSSHTCHSMRYRRRRPDLPNITSFNKQMLRLLINMQTKTNLFSRQATSDRTFLTDFLATPTQKGTQLDNIAFVSRLLKRNNKRKNHYPEFEIPDNRPYENDYDPYGISETNFDIMDYDELERKNPPGDVVPEVEEDRDMPLQQKEANYNYDMNYNTNDINFTSMDKIDGGGADEWLEPFHTSLYESDLGDTLKSLKMDRAKTSNNIIDVEETLPLSAITNSDELLSKSVDGQQRTSGVENNYQLHYDVHGDLYDDKSKGVGKEAYENKDTHRNMFSENIENNEYEHVEPESITWYNVNNYDENIEDYPDSELDEQVDLVGEEYDVGLSSTFVQTLIKTIQFLLNSILMPGTVSTQPNRIQSRPVATPQKTSSYVQKRRNLFNIPYRIPSAKYRRRRKNRKSKSKSKKLYLFGKDDRALVFLPLMRKYPFSNVVRLSSGCTGTLLTPYHVLTAAHCVHNGEDFKHNLQMLKIEIPDTMGFRVYYIQKIGIPKAWRRSGHLSEFARASYDYAIVKLNIGVPGKTTFLPLTVPKSNVLNQHMNFLGFPTDGRSSLYKSKCQACGSINEGNLILARCDSAVGNSGASVFIDDPRDGKKIVGVLSSISFTPRYSIITALTWNKLYEICSMMAPLGQQYGVCPSVEAIMRSNKTPEKNSVLPFFG